jgi:WhiB family transcriptional regulator, redox-sensing transcriptional regulator
MTVTWRTGDWRSAGACLSADPDLFFPISMTGSAFEQIARAKAVCAGCTVRRQCLEFAMDHDQTYGIWGGTTPEDRQRARRRRRRAAAGFTPSKGAAPRSKRAAARSKRAMPF